MIIRPTLNLDFMRGVPADSRLQLARSSTQSTYHDRKGLVRIAGPNVPRLQHTNGDTRGLLIEQSATNLVLRSGNNNNGWTSNSSVRGNTALTTIPAPGLGEFWTRIKRIPQADPFAGSYTAVVPTNAVPVNSMATASFYWNQETARFATVSHRQTTNSNRVDVTFDCYTGTSQTTAATNVSRVLHGKIYLGNGVWRCWVSHIPLIEPTIGSLYIAPAYAANYTLDSNVPGSWDGSILAWGAQVEPNNLTSLIPTVGAANARFVDVVNARMGEWYNPAGGTFVMAFRRGMNIANNSTRAGYLTLRTDAGGLMLLVREASGNMRWYRRLVTGGPEGGPSVPNTQTAHGERSVAVMSYSDNVWNLAVDGVSATWNHTGNPGGITPNSLQIGGSAANFEMMNGELEYLRYMPGYSTQQECHQLSVTQ